MEDTLQQTDFFHREGSYEVCAVLLHSTRTRQELITMIGVPERSIDRRLSEAVDLGLIERVPTTTPESRFRLLDGGLSEDVLWIIECLLSCHQLSPPREQESEALDPDGVTLHRSTLNETEPTDRRDCGRCPSHANVSGGTSSFH